MAKVQSDSLQTSKLEPGFELSTSWLVTSALSTRQAFGLSNQGKISEEKVESSRAIYIFFPFDYCSKLKFSKASSNSFQQTFKIF